MVDDNKALTHAGDVWEPDPDEKPQTLADLNKEYELTVLHQKAEVLVGETFTIFGMRKVPSDKPGPGYYYFCNCQDPKSKELFTTSLGGQALLDLLDKVIVKAVKQPFTVTLDFVKGGDYDGYYIFR